MQRISPVLVALRMKSCVCRLRRGNARLRTLFAKTKSEKRRSCSASRLKEVNASSSDTAKCVTDSMWTMLA